METESRPSHLPQDPHWLGVEAVALVDGKEIPVRKEKYFVSDLDRIKPEAILQNEGFPFKMMGMNQDLIDMLKRNGEAERVWVETIDKDGRIIERVLRFRYSLEPVRNADMLRAKDI